MSSTSSSWWLEKSTAAPRAASPRSTSASVWTATGSRPANGSSSTSSSGSCSSAAASCTRCWFPCESSSSFAPARTVRPSRSSQRPAAARAAPASSPWRQPEVLELVGDRHPRIEATLLRHVAEAHALGQPDRAPVPEHLAAVGLDEPEDGPHRGRLARAVRPEKAEHPAARDRERAVVERLHRPEPLAHVPELEAAAGGRLACRAGGRKLPGPPRDSLALEDRRHGSPSTPTLTQSERNPSVSPRTTSAIRICADRPLSKVLRTAFRLSPSRRSAP